ncbi:hypothetical protein G7048_03435 [Diaphorobacter sp. HDW4B]|uniref:hypothetical protein n=1 Tax=Diaphorobacter sp. HDW4B TaxID=2714925 RepID=UPI0014089B19|nr:hypothetical protein [Diaphorobacter sp. HDW4B]QIL69509.1 hypothetical protein G7048_03435 [Diaphorobacter sp. HDW4B]
MSDQIHSFIKLFQERSELLEIRGCIRDGDEPIVLLARWLTESEDHLSDDDISILADIGGMLYQAQFQERKFRPHT